MLNIHCNSQTLMKHFENEIERELRQRIYDALLGDVVTSLWKEANYAEESTDRGLYSYLLNNGVEITSGTMPRINSIIEKVFSNIHIQKDNIEFFLLSDADSNALTIENPIKHGHYYVVITSGLINLLSDDELCFVIGHEIGHILRQDTQIERLLTFVFPQEDSIPLVLRHTIRLWRQLAELGADGWGLCACQDFEISMSALNKIVLGVGYERLHTSVYDLLAYHKGLLEKLRDQPNLLTHPGLSIRIANLDYLANSEESEQIEKSLSYLAELMLEIGNGDTDRYMSLFLATAGLIVAEADGEVSVKERNIIYDHLASYCIFPQLFLERISKGDVKDIFAKSVKKITTAHPDFKPLMMAYMAHLAIIDRKVYESELATLYQIGKIHFNYSHQDVASLVAQMIRLAYVPQYDKLY